LPLPSTFAWVVIMVHMVTLLSVSPCFML